MSITNITEHSAAGSYRVETDKGATHHVPKTDNEALERFGVKQWIDDGNNISEYVPPEKSWVSKRLATMENGGYGTIGEQLEMIGEQGMDVYQSHIAQIKQDIPKENK